MHRRSEFKYLVGLPIYFRIPRVAAWFGMEADMCTSFGFDAMEWVHQFGVVR